MSGFVQHVCRAVPKTFLTIYNQRTPDVYIMTGIAAPSIRADSRRLRDLVGVGRSIEADLRSLGVKSVAQLAACDGAELYRQLCRKTHTHQDPCVLDTFRCAVAQARNPNLSLEQRNWWWWSRQRKQGNA